VTIGFAMPPKTSTSQDLDHLSSRIDECMLIDRPNIRETLRRARRAARANKPYSNLLDRLNQAIHKSQSRATTRRNSTPKLHYPQELPVSQAHDELLTAIAKNQVVVICGQTGSGKTTQIPKLCLELNRGVVGTIAHTQPRRIAARTVAQRISHELHSPLGNIVGVKMRFTDETSPQTRIKLVTDGLLLAETQSDPKLLRYDTIIIDEAHERSLNIDFLLGYTKRLLAQRPELKLIITSATIDPQRFSEHFNDAPIVEVSGKTYPVDINYSPMLTDDRDEPDLDASIRTALTQAFSQGPGDVLVFLSGEREIRDAADSLRERPTINHESFEVLPLYARLSMDEQSRVFKQSRKRRVVLATNVAETSVTVPGIHYVIDPGFARISRYGTRTRVHRLPIEPISQASANQRAGRCGRLAPGICYRLYSKEDHDARPQYTDPEITRTNLAGVILQMKALRLGDIHKFPFLDPPEHRALRDGLDTLHELGALDQHDAITDIGTAISRLPLDPRQGRMLHAGQGEQCLREALIVCSMLSIQDPRERPLDKQRQADTEHARWHNPDSDFLSILSLWDEFHKQLRGNSRKQLRLWCTSVFLSYPRMRDWIETHRLLRDIVTEQSWPINNTPASHNAIHRALLTGMLAAVGRKTDGFEYQGVRGTSFNIHPGSCLFAERPQWLMSAELVRTTKLYARMVAAIQPRWIDRVAPHVVKRRYTDPAYDASRGQVMAYETVSLWGLPVIERRRVHYGPIDPRASRELFIHHGLVDREHTSTGRWQKHNQKLEAELRKLEAKSRRDDIISQTSTKFEFFDTKIPDTIYTAKAFEEWRTLAERTEPTILFMDRQIFDTDEPDDISEHSHPDQIPLAGSTSDVEYRLEPGLETDGVTITVPLEKLASLTQTQIDWLVPGLLHERIIERIRQLPKSLRTSFIPAPNYARKALAQLETLNTPVDEAIARALEKLGGVSIPRDRWATDPLPDHLRIRLRVTDADNAPLATSRDVLALKHELRDRITAEFASLPHDVYNRDGITSWDFGELHEQIKLDTEQGTLVAYPALVDEKNSVALRVFPDKAAALRSHTAGLRRLLMLRLSGELRYLGDRLQNFEHMALLYAPIGNPSELRDQILSRIVERTFLEESDLPRDAESFEQRIEQHWSLTASIADTVCVVTQSILTHANRLRAALDRAPSSWQKTTSDLLSQLDALLTPNFLRDTPWLWLQHFPRYLAAMEHRLHKLADGGAIALDDDQRKLTDIHRCQQAYDAAQTTLETRDANDPELERFYWMIQEYRVQVFAQQLGTSLPVSPQRLEAQWEKVRKN
jgi:ATP-dependent RNA helicase HrpA